ncbi:MAG: hypothetical protein JNJ65_18530 [Cyclobacteriaceae bacterium]|nr:hypothetical protein [Cyclobacteriaceae bacterium]
MKDSIIQKVIGYILLIPPILSVALFVLQIYFGQELKVFNITSPFFLSAWTGFIGGTGGGYTSLLPLYFGIMAIAGAYLIKENKK